MDYSSFLLFIFGLLTFKTKKTVSRETVFFVLNVNNPKINNKNEE